MKFNFKLNLKVSAFYLGKQKSFIPKINFFGRTAKIHPKDGISCLDFPEGFDFTYQIGLAKAGALCYAEFQCIRLERITLLTGTVYSRGIN